MEISEDRFIECMAIDFPNFKISKNNLTHPTSQFVISFYSMILRQAIEIDDPDELWNVTEDQRAYINSYHTEAVTFGQHVWIFNLHQAIKYVFDHLSENGSEFVYSDILFPEHKPRRSFVFMALMLNFFWYMNDFAVDLDSDISACMKRVEFLNNLKNEKEKCLSNFRDLDFQKSQYTEIYKEKKKLILTITESNNEKETIIKELLEDEEAFQKNFKKGDDERERLQANLTELLNEKNYYESLIVSNENQVRDVYEKHVIEKDECVKKMKNIEEQVKAVSNVIAKYNKVLELQQKLNHALNAEKFFQDLQGIPKGFQNLYMSIAEFQERKKRLSEEALTPEQQFVEGKEMLAKLTSEEAKLEAEEQSMMANRKEKLEASKRTLNEHKKIHSELLAQLRKESEMTEDIIAYTNDLTIKQTKLDEECALIDAVNRTKFKTYMNEMESVFSTLEDIFGDQFKDILGLHLIDSQPDSQNLKS